MRLHAHAIPELTLASTASLQVDGLARGADALVLEPALERCAAMSATIGAGLLLLRLQLWLGAGDIIARGNLSRQLAHRDLLVWRRLYKSG